MFDKHKLKKLEKLRKLEGQASFVQGEKDSEDEEENRYAKRIKRKKELRREILKSLVPGFAVTFLVGIIIYYIASPLGHFAAFGIAITMEIVSNLFIYIYTNKIYIPPGIDFVVFGPEYIDDPTSRKIFGMWRVPTALTGNIRKDLEFIK